MPAAESLRWLLQARELVEVSTVTPDLAEATRVVAVRLREDVYATDPPAQMLVHADDLERIADKLEQPDARLRELLAKAFRKGTQRCGYHIEASAEVLDELLAELKRGGE